MEKIFLVKIKITETRSVNISERHERRTDMKNITPGSWHSGRSVDLENCGSASKKPKSTRSTSDVVIDILLILFLISEVFGK